MPRHFFRKVSPSRQRVLRQLWLRPIQHLLDEPKLWAVRRQSIIPAVAIGIFCAWLPIPGHSIVAGLLAIAISAHLPVSMLMTFVVNPATIGPMYFAAYRVGRELLNLPARDFSFELSWRWILEEMDALWQPLFLGCTILGAATAAIAYVTLHTLWRLRITRYLSRRSRRNELAANTD